MTQFTRPLAVLILFAAGANHFDAQHLSAQQRSPNVIAPLAPTGRAWSDMNYGPYLSMTIEAPRPGRNIAYKGVMICVDRPTQTHMLFDADLLRFAAGWTGGTIDWQSVVYDGSHNSHPKISGLQLFGNPVAPGWADPGETTTGGATTDAFADPRERPYGPLPRDHADWRGLYVHGDRVVLSYTVGGTGVLELPAVESAPRSTLQPATAGDGVIVSRTLELEPSAKPLTLQIAHKADAPHAIVDQQRFAPLATPKAVRGNIAVLGDLAPPNKPQTPPKPVVPKKGLVAHWPLDEGTGKASASTDRKSLLGLQDAVWTQGRFGNAITVGSGNGRPYAIADEVKDLQWGGRDYTAAAWVKSSGGGTIVSFTKLGEWVAGGKSLFIRDGRLAFDIGWVGVVAGSTQITDGRWHHVAVTHQAKDGTVRLFVDGVQDGKGQLKSTPDPEGSRLHVGFTSSNFPGRGANRLRGMLDDVALFNRALSGEEIRRMAPGSRVRDDRLTSAAVTGDVDGCEWISAADGSIRLTIPPHDETKRIKVLIWSGPREMLPRFAAAVRVSKPPIELAPLTQGGPARFPQVLTTHGTVAANSDPYVIDTITPPDQNPWNSWMRFGGFDFFPEGKRAAVCTWNGDVWIVSGVDELRELRWLRIATGMFQPLGLKIVDGEIFVCCRDQITRLVDSNGDGETDFYEAFNHDHRVTEHFHEFAMDLQTDADGDFYYAKSARHALDSLVPHHGTLLKVSEDGEETEIVCNGFRAANGVGIGPNGELATSDQEGHWTPANRINLVEPGGFYGNMFSFHEGERPTDYLPPVCWLPRPVDRSPAEQLWVPDDRWGPVKGSMLSISYGTGRVSIVPYEKVDGVPQGAAMRLPLEFPTGVMRGRFHPANGQLYLCGLFGWSSNKTQPGGFYRVRYTGQPVLLPVGWHAVKNGVELEFTEPLDRSVAENPQNFSLKKWNYRWTGNYGSKHYSVSRPEREGEDPVVVKSATLSKDGRRVFLAVVDVRPVMQLEIAYLLKTARGQSYRQELYATINKPGPPRDLKNPTKPVTPRGRLTAAEEKSLQPGVMQVFDSVDAELKTTDARSSRLVALHIPEGTAATPFLESGPFTCTISGYVKVDLPGEFTFIPRGAGDATLEINGDVVFKNDGNLRGARSGRVALHAGYNRLEVGYVPPADRPATFRLYWSSEQFAEEPLPPTRLFHNGTDARLVAGNVVRRGRELFATHSCVKCHGLPGSLNENELAMPEIARKNPDLKTIAERIRTDWLTAWIWNPRALRNHVTMPCVVPRSDAGRQQAADIAAYVSNFGRRIAEAADVPADAEVKRGRVLYEDLGCIACHRATAPDVEDENDRTTLLHAGLKFGKGALREFLRDPRRHYIHSRMPDFHLDDAEAAALAAYVRSVTAPELPGGDFPAGDAARGKTLFESSGCARCHPDNQDTAAKPAPPNVLLQRIAGGCLAAEKEARATAPDFGFSKDDRAVLAAFLATDGKSLARRTPIEAAHRAVEALSCTACHKQDGVTAARPILIAEEGVQGRLPEILPDLTWTGEKLKPEWTHALFAGRLEEKPRPFLKARMPSFKTRADLLAEGLSAGHGFPAIESPQRQRPNSPETIEIGRKLTLRTGGFNCVQCHAVGKEEATAAFDARGVNFHEIARRMRYDFYPRWMLNPARIEPSSKMPVLAPNLESTSIKDVYKGDARRQFDAIWRYLEAIEPRRAVE